MDNHIRKIGQEHAEDSIRLSEFAFQFDMSDEVRREQVAKYEPDTNWGYFVDEQLAAKLTVLPLQVWINGASLEMGGIAGVATWPEFRRHGMVKKLLLNALQTMKAAGQTISFLSPFEFPFYRKFGWETYTEHKKYEIPKEQIFRPAHSVGQVKRNYDWAAIKELYQAYAKQFNGTLARSEKWWTHNIMPQNATAAIYYNEAGVAKGYVQYKVSGRVLNVDELIYLDEQSRLGLWKFIADHDSMIEKVVLKAPANDQLAFTMANPRFKQEVIPYFMARIVDLIPFLEAFPATEGLEKCKIVLHINDEYAAWNEGAFTVKWNSSGKAKVKQGAPAESKKAKEVIPSAACSIGTLTSMFLGYQRPAFLQSLGRLEATDEAIDILEKLIPHRTTYLMDFF